MSFDFSDSTTTLKDPVEVKSQIFICFILKCNLKFLPLNSFVSFDKVDNVFFPEYFRNHDKIL